MTRISVARVAQQGWGGSRGAGSSLAHWGSVWRLVAYYVLICFKRIRRLSVQELTVLPWTLPQSLDT